MGHKERKQECGRRRLCEKWCAIGKALSGLMTLIPILAKITRTWIENMWPVLVARGGVAMWALHLLPLVPNILDSTSSVAVTKEHTVIKESLLLIWACSFLEIWTERPGLSRQIKKTIGNGIQLKFNSKGHWFSNTGVVPVYICPNKIISICTRVDTCTNCCPSFSGRPKHLFGNTLELSLVVKNDYSATSEVNGWGSLAEQETHWCYSNYPWT